MAVIPPPHCPVCGDPRNWKRGLVYHREYIHYRESAINASGEAENLATIVERTRRTPAVVAPERQIQVARGNKRITLEVS